MTMERVGVQAVVEGAGGYVNDAGRVNAATLGMAQSASSAEASFNVFARAQADMQARMRQTGSLFRETGTQAIFLGAALAAPGALAVKFAIDFESAFAGVRKTVEATEGQFGELREGILDLTSTLPTSAKGLADIAAAAGQLGVARADILAFTNVTAKLAETTDLTTDAAATGLARFANVLSIPQAEIENTASALVDLGNKSAATESEILDLAQRLAASGKTIGLSASEVLAFGTALRSVGIESEAGGTAFSRVFIEIAKAVEGGGRDLERFAAVADQTSTDFAESFRTNAAGAIVDFVEGLGRMQATGRGTFGVLEDLSLNDARLTRALLSAASAGDLFRESLATGASAFRENSALSVEFQRRIETTGAQFRLFVNDLQRFGIEAGTVLLPAARAVIGVLRDMAGGVNALPGPLKGALAAMSLFGGAAIIAVGTLGVFAGSVLNVIAVMPQLLTGLSAATAALRAFAVSSLAFIAANPVAVLAAVVVAAGAAAFAYYKLRGGSEEVRKAQDELKDATEAVVKAQRDATKAAKERREAEEKGEVTSDVQKAADIAALAAAELQLADAINAVAAANEADARARAKRFTRGPSGPIPEPEDRTAPAAAREPGAGAALLGRAQQIAPGTLQQQVEAEALKGMNPPETTESVLAREITNLRDPLAAVNPELERYIATLTVAQQAALTAAVATREDTAAKFQNAEAQQAEQQAEAAGIEIVNASVTAKARAAEANRNTRTAMDQLLVAQRALDAVMRDGNSTSEQVAQAQNNVAAAERAVRTAANEAAAAVRDATVAFGANIAVTNADAEAVEGLAKAYAAVAAAKATAAEPGARATAEADFAGRGEDIRTPQTQKQAEENRRQEASDARSRAGDLAARINEQVAAATKAGKGGASILDRRKEAIESTQQRQREEQAGALIRERLGPLKLGEKSLGAVQSEQRRLDAAFTGVIDELRALGFEVPEEFRDMFDRINAEAEDGAKNSGNKIGGLLGFLIARRLGKGLDPTAGLIAQPASVTAGLARSAAGGPSGGVNIENVNIGPGTTTGDIQQGMGVAYRGAFGAT